MADVEKEWLDSLEVDTTARTARQWAELEPEERRGKFFLSSVSDERVLQGIKRLLERGLNEADFVHEAYRFLGQTIDPATGEPYYNPQRFEGMSDAERMKYQRTQGNLDAFERLRLIFRTQMSLAYGFREFVRAFEPFWLEMYPGWRFVRQAGAKERWKRPLHVAHEGVVRLKTDYRFWLRMNAPEIGGFNNPYGPWGFNSWMRCEPVSRRECEKLGLLQPGENVTIPPELARWGLPQAMQQANTAGVATLDAEGRQRVIDRNRERGTQVEEKDGTMQPKPQNTHTTPRGAADDDMQRRVQELLRQARERAAERVREMKERVRKQREEQRG